MGGYSGGISSNGLSGGNGDINIQDSLLGSSLRAEVGSPLGGSSDDMSGTYALLVAVAV